MSHKQKESKEKTEDNPVHCQHDMPDIEVCVIMYLLQCCKNTCICNCVAIKFFNYFLILTAILRLKCKFVLTFIRSDALSDLLFTKILLMPPLIAGVTLAVRKWGEGLGGWIGGFPWVAGPISFFIALEHGALFAASTITSALLGSVGTMLFALIYCIAVIPSFLAANRADQLCGLFCRCVFVAGTSHFASCRRRVESGCADGWSLFFSKT